jgi:adenylate cyclase
MAGFRGRTKDAQGSAMSAEFHQILMREVMTTELLRIKALIGTIVLLGTISSGVYFFAPDAVSRVWHGNLNPLYLYAIIVPFILFEMWVHAAITRHMRKGRDLPVIRRYIGALVETSMPTVALALQINSMGSEAALGFVTPLTYFIFIILSTLRLDFWLSIFHRIRRGCGAVLHGDVLSSGRRRRAGAEHLLSCCALLDPVDRRPAGGRGWHAAAPAI